MEAEIQKEYNLIEQNIKDLQLNMDEREQRINDEIGIELGSYQMTP